MKILFGYMITYLFVLGLLLVAGILKKHKGCKDETCRKLVHILVSFTWLIVLFFFSDTWHMIIPPITFVIINFIAYKKDKLQMINRNKNKQSSLGTVYYPISTVILSVLTILDERWLIPYGIGMFCMAFGDGLAPYFGRKWKLYSFRNKKTLGGTISVFVISFLVMIIFISVFHLPLTIVEMVFISLTSAVLEFIGTKGLDNLFLPVGVAVVSYLLILF